jgi:NAD(P)-dependent dehydrogenase (short-subunit alcohol dehydrogenase family)
MTTSVDTVVVMSTTSEQTQLVALVTGGNKGIGKAIVAGLTRAGLTVFLGARDQVRGARASRTWPVRATSAWSSWT